jgi:hypothetical protein
MMSFAKFNCVLNCVFSQVLIISLHFCTALIFNSIMVMKGNIRGLLCEMLGPYKL